MTNGRSGSVDIFGKIAERKIAEAMEEGAFEGLKGAGKPLVLEDESHVPEDLRLAFRVLKNAGFLPPELELKKEITALRDLIVTIDDEKERLRKIRELNFKLMKLSEMRKRPVMLERFPEYEERFFLKAAARKEEEGKKS